MIQGASGSLGNAVTVDVTADTAVDFLHLAEVDIFANAGPTKETLQVGPQTGS